MLYVNTTTKLFVGEEHQQRRKDDLLNVCSLCPYTNGLFIFNARNLYNSLFSEEDNVEVFENACGTQSANRGTNNTEMVKETKPFSIEVYPNPVTDKLLQVSFKNNNSYNQLTITDMFGRTLKTERVLPSITHLNLPLNFGAGVYMLNITNEKTGYKEVQKIVVQ